MLSFNMQGEDIVEHISDKLSSVYVLVCKMKMFLSILMPKCQICVHIQSTCTPLCNIRIYLTPLSDILMPR